MKNKSLRRLAVASAVALIAVGGINVGQAKNDKPSGPGHVIVGMDASTWTSNDPVGPGLIPIGGAGQINGEFTIAERNGIQIGLRAQQRFVGPLLAVPNYNNKVGVYEAAAGFSDLSGRATWNYDWHVDLRDAHGVAAGKTIGDFDLTLETDIAATTLFGFPLPLDLTFGGFVPAGTILYQNSLNPKFGNPPFDAAAPGTYTISLVLTPQTFKGPPLKVTIQVNVN